MLAADGSSGARTTALGASRAVFTDVDPTGRRENLDGLAASRRQTPQRRGRLVVVLGRAHRHEQHVTVGR